MKKFFLITLASLISVCAMAAEGDGKTKADAIKFDWDKGVTHTGGTLWYRVDLTPLYEEENPSLTLYLTNPSNVVGDSVKVSMQATVAGQEESKDYTIAARQYKTYTANAKALITLRQKEIYLTLTTKAATAGGSTTIKLSAKVFESADLDETCRDAETLKWGVETTQNPMYSKWWRINLKDIKDTTKVKKDAMVTIKNIGTKTVHLKAGQSLDCPSSGTTRRDYDLAPNESILDTIPQSMILNVQPDELYFGLENVESKISIRVDYIDQPVIPIIPGPADMVAVAPHVDPTDTVKQGVPAATAMQGLTIDAGTTLYKFSVKDLNAFSKYEPEFTYRNNNATPAKVTVKMAFVRPAYGTTNTYYDIAAGEEEVVVYKKNMLDGLEGVDSIYLLTTTDQPITFLARYKHVREGKACKTNIDFNWETGHTQEARTTQWYAINVAQAKTEMQDIIVYLYNTSNAAATIKASMAFSCPYIDLTEMSRTISKNDTVSRRLGYSSYAMMSDTIWIGLETNQEIRFWATTEDAKAKEEVDCACQKADTLNWKEGAVQEANDTVWYVIDMTKVRETAAKFPTVFVQNMSSTAAATITAEMSLECPDSLENQQRTLTIAANDSYSKKIARNMFENIKDSVIYLRVISTQKISLQIRLNEEAEGTSCASAIPFNWTSGHSQAAGSSLWYKMDLREAMAGNYDLNLTVENTGAAACDSCLGQLTFGCPDDEAPSVQYFDMAKYEKKTIFRPHSWFRLLPDSTIYFNLYCKTAMRISAEMVTPAPFTPITGEGLALDTLLLDAKETTIQDADTQWYLIPKEEIAHLRELIKTKAMTPNIRIENNGAADYDVTIEVADSFPINEAMISKKVTVSAGEAFVLALDYKLFKQAITKFDSILVRITIPAEAANNISFKSGMEKAFHGNTKEAAVPITIGETLYQDGNTMIWYKLNTADLKKDKSLINRRIKTRTANLGTASTNIKVEVYEGLQAKVDMFEQFGLDSYRERKIPAGEDRSRTLPFQNLLMVGDVELYIQVTTTQKIMFRTNIDGEYAAIEEDTKQHEATLLVPNVDYKIPGDGEAHWYQICIPYIRDNHKYSHESSLTYIVDKPTTVEVMNTVMDTMTYNFPSRKHTFSSHVNTMLLSEIISRGIARANNRLANKDGKIPTIDITSFPEDFIDSLLHRYITSDSLTMYIRYKTDADMTVRLNMPQVKGLNCNTSVKFDWEHGFINPTEQTNYIHVQLDSTRVPEGKDLKLHMDRWDDVLTNVKADFFAEDCQGDPLGSLNKTIDRDTFRILKREFLQNIGWSGLMIQYYSDTTTHLWAELIESVIPDTIKDTIPMFVCKGDSILFPDTAYCFYQDSSVIVLKDSVNKSEGKYYKWQILYNVKLLQRPDFAKLHLQIDELENAPDIKSGAAIDVTATTTEIDSILNVNHKDSIQKVDTIIWEYFYIGDDNFKPFPMPKPVLTETAIALRYYVVTECARDTIWSNPYIHVPRHTDTITTCGPYTWPTTGETYKKIGITTDSLRIVRWTSPNVENINLDSVSALILTITPDILPTAIVDTCAKEYKWSFNDSTYTATTSWTVYVDTILDTVSGCYQIDTLKLKFTPEPLPTVTVDTCSATFTWDFNNLPYTPTATWTEYTDTVKDAGGSCYQACTLKLRFTPDTAATENATVCEFPYTWNGRKYNTAGVYDTILLDGTCYTYHKLDLKEITPIFKQDTFVACNEYTLNGITYQDSTIVNDTVQTDYDCDSIITTHHIHITHPVIKTLSLIKKYGDRIFMINRNEINDSTAIYLDLETDQDKVVWYVEDPAGDKPVGITGYYLTNPDASKNGKYIQQGKKYYAKIEIPGDSVNCGYMAETVHKMAGETPSSAPAIRPSLARPGEDIQVLNLNPEETTTIRVYTSEGLIQGTYTAHGEETFAIKAANEHGFYLVELRSESDQSTLRYIVK